MKRRDLVVAECVGAFQACFQHYSDAPLDHSKVVQLRAFADGLLPEKISTAEWQQYADDYDTRVEQERELDED
jgi:hypothetical protein